MGMYTELFICCAIDRKTPQPVIDVLRYLFDWNGSDKWEPYARDLPEHEFFKCDRWGQIGQGCSAYFIGRATGSFETPEQGEWILTSRSDLKNYSGEIGKFIDWLTPYICMDKDTCIGWKRYEEDIVPTLLFHPNKWRYIRIAKPDEPYIDYFVTGI